MRRLELLMLYRPPRAHILAGQEGQQRLVTILHAHDIRKLRRQMLLQVLCNESYPLPRNVRACICLYVYILQDSRAVLERGILDVLLDGLVAS